MDFLKNNDFYKVIQKDELTDIVGEHEGDQDDGTAILEGLELDAMGEMNGYLAVRFDAKKCMQADDDGKRIPIIVQKLVDIVLYNAYASISPNNIPKLREVRYENAINWLEKVASGYINPDLPVRPGQPSTPLRYGSSQPKMDNFY